MRRACYGDGLFGPASLYACLRRQVDQLRKSPGEPGLAEFSSADQASMRRACYGDGLFGPANLYACLRRQADQLRKSPGEPSLAEFSRDEQASMRRACYGDGLFGPASLHACLRRQADDLRKVKRELGLVARPQENALPATNARVESILPDVEPAVRADDPGSTSSRAVVTPPRLSENVASGRTNVAAKPGGVRPSRPAPARVVPNEPPTIGARPAPRQVLPPQRQAASGQPPRKGDDVGWTVLFWALVIGGWVVRRRISARAGRQARRPNVPPQGAPPPPPHRARHTRQVDPRIVFADQRPDGASAEVTPALLNDLRDAVTGQVLHSTIGLSRCAQCRVFYQRASLDFLRHENGGRCVACGSLSIFPFDESGGHQQSGRNYEPGIASLTDYRSKVGQIVIFEGRCVAVRTSARGTAYAAMFETGGWTRGFKLVFRTASVQQVGGPEFIWGLAGKHIRVRGLIVHHPQYGYEIVVNDASMILGVRT